MLMHHPNLPGRPPVEIGVDQFRDVWRHREWEEYVPPEEVAALAEEQAQQTVKDVLTDVGDDPDAARRALDAENASPAPRVTLTAQLERIAATSDTTEQQES